MKPFAMFFIAAGYIVVAGSSVNADDQEPHLEFSSLGDDLVVTTTVEADNVPYVLWTHSEIDWNEIGMGPPVGSLPIGKPEVTLFYYVFQIRNDPAGWNATKRTQRIRLKWRLVGHKKSDEVYRVRNEFLPSDSELEMILPDLRKLAKDAERRRANQPPP